VVYSVMAREVVSRLSR